MDDTTDTPTQVTSLRVMYDPRSQSPALMLEGAVYTLDPATAEVIAKGLQVAVAMANRARSAELN